MQNTNQPAIITARDLSALTAVLRFAHAAAEAGLKPADFPAGTFDRLTDTGTGYSVGCSCGAELFCTREEWEADAPIPCPLCKANVPTGGPDQSDDEGPIDAAADAGLWNEDGGDF